MGRRPVDMIYLGILLAAGVSAPQIYSQISRMQWEAEPTADYYEGLLSTEDGSFRIRTRETWLLLPKSSELTLEAFDGVGRSLGPVAPRIHHLPAEDHASEAESSDWLEGTEQTDEELAAPAAPTPAIVATKRKPLILSSSMTLSLGAGKEWISAEGGLSNFNGSSNIGGTMLTGRWLLDDSPWFLAAELTAHNFSTDTREEFGEQTISEAKETKLLRTAADISAFYNLTPLLLGTAAVRLGIGIGMAHIRLAGFEAEDDSGIVALEEKSFTSPSFSAIYLHQIGMRTEAGFLVQTYPLPLGKVSNSLSVSASAHWRQLASERVFWQVGLYSRRDTLRYQVDCPDLKDCQTNAKTTSNLLQARMGIGITW